MLDELVKVIIPARGIVSRVASPAGEINASYADNRGGITIVTVMTGSLVFLADLVRRLPLRLHVAPLATTSCPGKTTKSQGTRPKSAILPDLCNSDVLIVDDILDTGGTLRTVRDLVLAGGPRSVHTTVLLRKPAVAPPNVPVGFVGFDIEDEFVVGYGLDYDGLYRNLPYIEVLKPELYEPERLP